MRTSQSRRRPTWQFVLGTAVLSRLALLIGLFAGHSRHGYPAPAPGSYGGVRNWWLNPLTFYDSEQFSAIAHQGYDRARVAFFPLYPALLRIGGRSEVAVAAVGVLVSTIAFVAALFLSLAWLRVDHSERIARRAVWLVAFYPLGVLWSSVYTESLFVFGLAGLLWAMRTSRWLLAVLFGVMAGATRNTGLVLAAALLLQLVVSARREHRVLRAAPLLAALSPLVPFVAFEGWVIRRFGSDAPRAAQEAFGRRLRGPWWALAEDVRSSLAHGPGLVASMNLLAIALGVLCAVLAAVHGRWIGTVLIVGVLAMHLSFPTGNIPHTTGAARYLMPLLPFHEELAVLLERFAQMAMLRRAAMAVWVLLGVYVSQQIGMKFFVMG